MSWSLIGVKKVAWGKMSMNVQGMKFFFFSESHLAPKFFKVVANSKKVGCHFQRQTKPFVKLSVF